MRAAKNGIADKLGITFSPNPCTIRLRKIRREKDWTDILKNPAKYTKGKLF